jgi:FkbM family methyltransferase
MTKIKTTDVHLSLLESTEKGLLQKIERKTDYFDYTFWIRGDDEYKLNIKQNITVKAEGGEYFSPLLRPHWNENGTPFDIWDLDREDTWLDAGGHIGLFATRVLTQFPKVKKVISYEPFRNNIDFAELNLESNGVSDRCEMVEAALTPEGNEPIDFYLAWDSGKHSVLDIRGREKVQVPTVDINTALEGVTAIKMDIEGAEYDIIKAVKDWSNIRVALIEYHFHYRPLSKDREAKFREIIEIFKQNFDDVYVYPGVEGTKTWITHFAAVKRD